MRAALLLALLHALEYATPRRLHAGFSTYQAQMLFSDRLFSLSTASSPIKLRERDLGVLVAHDDNRVHVFCHCNHCIYHCLWDNRSVWTGLQKMNILRSLRQWHAQTYGRNVTQNLTLCTVDCEDMWAWDRASEM